MSRLLIQEPPLQVLPSLAVAIGLNEAIFIQQLHYWLADPNIGVEKEGHKWVYNSNASWLEQFPFWSESTLRRTLMSLKKKKLIIVMKLSEDQRDRTNYYRIDYQCLDSCTSEQIHAVKMTACLTSVQNDPLHAVKMTACYKVTETTKTETTTESKTTRAREGTSDCSIQENPENGLSCVYDQVFPCTHVTEAMSVVSDIFGRKIKRPHPSLHAFVHDYSLEDVHLVADDVVRNERDKRRWTLGFAFAPDSVDARLHAATHRDPQELTLQEKIDKAFRELEEEERQRKDELAARRQGEAHE